MEPFGNVYAQRHSFKRSGHSKIHECCSQAISKFASLPQYEFASNESDKAIEEMMMPTRMVKTVSRSKSHTVSPAAQCDRRESRTDHQ
jgi:hypothetical protein